MPRNNQRNSQNNNPEGRNQYSGMRGMARENPYAAAATVAGTIAAGVFLWSKRNQISDQISSLSEQISEWSENRGSGGQSELEMAGGDTSFAATGANGSGLNATKSSSGMEGNRTSSTRQSGGSNSNRTTSGQSTGSTTGAGRS